MEIITTGKVTVAVRIENLRDVYKVDAGVLKPEEARSLEVPDALVDTGATMLCMPRGLIRRLGLRQQRMRTARTASGIAEFAVHDAVRLTIGDRDCVMEVAELPDECPVLIGQLPLEALDFVVDPVGQRLLSNPEHGGKQMIDMF